jgi:hypothetical protein
MLYVFLLKDVNAEVKKAWIYASTPPYAFAVVDFNNNFSRDILLKQWTFATYYKDSFAFLTFIVYVVIVMTTSQFTCLNS